MITVLVPAYNEARILNANVVALNECLAQHFADYRLVVIDSNSGDETGKIGRTLAATDPRIEYLNLDVPGKGAKIKEGALRFTGEVTAFVDADLPLKLAEFVELLERVRLGDADLAIAWRQHSSRPLRRKFVSAIGNALCALLLQFNVRDVFAGAKAWNGRVAATVWPEVRDERWFFDVELLHFSKRRGLRISEVQVTYADREDGQLKLASAMAYVTRQLARFVWRERVARFLAPGHRQTSLEPVRSAVLESDAFKPVSAEYGADNPRH
jgi:dolichol-phosphate mannosyltransferase